MHPYQVKSPSNESSTPIFPLLVSLLVETIFFLQGKKYEETPEFHLLILDTLSDKQQY